MIHLADTHCHLDFGAFSDDRPEVIERALHAGVQRILNPGIDLETSQMAIRLAEQAPEIYAAVGVHPNDALTWDTSTYDRLKKLAEQPKVVAIGEIGLDYHHEQAPIDLQKQVFTDQLRLAEETGLPVIVHSRLALPDTLQILTGWVNGLAARGHPLATRPGVMHSFEGKLADLQPTLDIRFLIGISGPVTYKNAPEKHALATQVPLEAMLTETDAPFLTPHPFRGRRNEPAHVRWVADTIAALRNQPVSTVADVTYQNAARLFAWSL